MLTVNCLMFTTYFLLYTVYCLHKDNYLLSVTCNLNTVVGAYTDGGCAALDGVMVLGGDVVSVGWC